MVYGSQVQVTGIIVNLRFPNNAIPGKAERVKQ